MTTSTRDRLLFVFVGLFVTLVLAGYAWTLLTGRSFSRIDFGMTPIAGQGAPKFLDGRVSPDSVTGRWISGDLTAQVRTYLRDEFVGFDRILTGYSLAVTAANRVFYQTLLPSAPIYPVGVDSGGVFFDPSEDSLVRASSGGHAAAQHVAEYVAATKSLTTAHPDVNFVFYGVPPWTMTQDAQEAGFNDPSIPAWNSFKSEVGTAAAADMLHVEDWSETFFATDHHWKPAGAYRGYTDIVRLLESQDSSLTIDLLPFSEQVVESVHFRGALSRKAAYVGLWEPFRVIMTHDPAVHAYRDGELDDGLIAPDDYFPNPPDTMFKNHHALYNGYDYPIVEYRSDRTNGHNLLIFADSYSNSMEDLLAAGFDRSYVVDLRYYQPQLGHPFDIDAFIAEKGITDVVFLSRPLTVMQMPWKLEMRQPL